jgi:nucleoside-diphosphate-sugar epimerase
MKILITGHSGLIGRAVARRMATLSGVDMKLFRTSERPRDLCDPDAVQEAVAGVDVVLHFAGLLNHSRAAAEDMFRVNVDGTALLMQAAMAQGVRAIVFASSQEVYAGLPDHPGPFTEDGPVLAGNDPYAKSKLAAKERCRQLVDLGRSRLVILRIAAVYGSESLSRDNVVARYVHEARTRGVIWVFGEGKRIRDLVWSEDVADVVAQWHKLSGIYNVGGGRAYTSLHIAELVAAITGLRIELEPTKSESVGYVMDIGKLRRATDYTPASLAEGLRQSLIMAGAEMGL